MNLELISKQPTARVNKTPLLFVHGAWHGAWCWDEFFLDYFAEKGYAAHALSLRGHGASDGKEKLRRARLADYVADVAQIAEGLPAPPIIISHSMGGMVTQKYLEMHAAPAAVLLASGPPTGIIPTTLRIARHHPWLFAKANLTMSLYPIVSTPKLAQEAFFSGEMPAEQAGRYFKMMGDESYFAFLDMLGLSLPKPNRINTPILVMGAEKDTIFTVDEVKKTAEIYGSEVVIFSNMAHDMMLESGWQDVADKILEWLNKLNL